MSSCVILNGADFVILNEADFVILNGAEGEVKDLEHQILRDHREKYVFLTLLPRTD